MLISKLKWGSAVLAVTCCITFNSLALAAPLVEARGADFQGGGQTLFGPRFYGRDGVNMVYALPSGQTAAMTLAFTLGQIPDEPLALVLEAMNDDSARACHIRLSLNDHELFAGASGFSNAHWQSRQFQIPDGILRAGTNQLVISNLEAVGDAGQPPWFMVARCAIADPNYKLPAIKPAGFLVQLPEKVRPFPEPLTSAHAQPGFKFRGTKGWAWTPDQYLEEIPFLVRYKMNFLMNCYVSMFTSPSNHVGEWTNEWWKPLPESKKVAYARVIRACQENGITFCFAIHPQLSSPRPFDFNRPGDVDDLYQNFDWAQGQGVHWFSVSLDDVSWSKTGPAAGGMQHARLVNTVIGRLRQKDPAAQLIFCPGPYSGDGTSPNDYAYLHALGQDLDPAVYVFWTGDEIAGKKISRKAAENYKKVVQHRLFLWDNYPVNDNAPTLHLGPVSGRAPDLCDVVDGYMSNPMARQNEINRIPLATCADYAYNPWAYDPNRSIGQAILGLAQTVPQQQVLKELVEAYPGFLIAGGLTGANPVRSRFEALEATADSRPEALDFLNQISGISTRLKKEFPGEFTDARQTVEDDVAWMKARL